MKKTFYIFLTGTNSVICLIHNHICYFPNFQPYPTYLKVSKKGFRPLLHMHQDRPREGETYGDIKIKARIRGPDDKMYIDLDDKS